MKDFIALLGRLPEDKGSKLKELLTNSPYWFLESLKVIKIPKNKYFIRGGEPANKVFILIEGNVKATDFRVFEVVYNYTWFEPVEIFGAMELYMDYEHYITTLITTTDCMMIEISRVMYEKWLAINVDVVLKQVKQMMRELDNQAKKERFFLFLNSIERLCYLMVSIYEQQERIEGKCEIELTKAELANYSAVNIRTINRVIKQLEDENLIVNKGRAITVNEEQCNRMKIILKTKTL